MISTAPGLGAVSTALLVASTCPQPFFEDNLSLDLAPLINIRRTKPRILIAHKYGDQGYTEQGFRGNTGPKGANTIMLKAEWQLDALFPKLKADFAIIDRDVGHLVDQRAFQAVHDLFHRGWYRNVEAWQLTEVILARLLRNDHGWLKVDPANANLIVVNGDSPGVQDYWRWQDAHDISPSTKTYLGVIPYARSMSPERMSEYRVSSRDINRTLLCIGRAKPNDIVLPMPIPLMPTGRERFADISDLFLGSRSWLLSFVGSAYRPGEPAAHLTIERYPVVKRLLRLAVAYEQSGVQALQSTALAQCVSQLHDVQGLRAKDGLFVAPMTRMPTSVANSTTSRWRTKDTQVFRSRWSKNQGSLGNVSFSSGHTIAAVNMLHGSSIFSLQLPGDGPYRTSQVSAMTMGAVPVIVDWQANALASWFRRVLFESQDRFEDIFVILDWRLAHEQPEYILHRLCTEVVSGRYRRRQQALRRTVDYLVHRADAIHEDAFSLPLQQAQYQHNMRQQKRQQMATFSKVQEWPHQAPMPPDITQTAGWNVEASQAKLRRSYAQWSDTLAE